MEDLFEIEPIEARKMSQGEFIEKAKLLLNKIFNNYREGWQTRPLKDEEFPDESICDKCTGCGVFKENGIDKECIQDRMEGWCYHRFFDYEQVGIGIEGKLTEIMDLISVDELNDNPQAS